MPPKRFSSTQSKSQYKSNYASGDYKRAKVKSAADDEDDESNGSSVLDIDIGKRKRLIVRDFKGTPLIDIREFYSKANPDGSEVWLPGRKGISLTIDVWEAVVAHIGDIENAIQKLTQGEIDTNGEAANDDLKLETGAEIKDDGQEVNSEEE
ncbi:transcriptional Coactivator p15-domain-containing protein [Lipomyces orientalis]|uniref:Transcriptional Coactivator p15-domain-containing protein n=1 Tax=Lipomyces orientalis TaxID=1233043 RepID=A0ACC3TUZ9_9ASCO